MNIFIASVIIVSQLLFSQVFMTGLQGCNNVIFFEARKHQDLYVWIAKAPGGPTVKFHCTNGEPATQT